MNSKKTDGFDSKFRFCIVAGIRAIQIQGGALSELKNVSSNPAYIAIKEAEAGLIKWRILVDEDALEEE